MSSKVLTDKNANTELEGFRKECMLANGSFGALDRIYARWTARRVKYIDEMDLKVGQAIKIINLCPEYKEHCELILHDYKHRLENGNGKEIESISEKFRRYVPIIFEQAKFIPGNGQRFRQKVGGTAEQQQLLALKIFPNLLSNGRFKKSMSRHALVVEKPKSLTPQQFVRKLRNSPIFGPNRRSKRKHPRQGPLIVVIRKKPKLDLRLLVDNQLLKIGGDPALAFELFFAAHRTFDIKFDSAIRELVPFLNRMTGLNRKSRLRFGYKNLYDILEEAI